jgi:hypothetical protein
VRRLTRSHKKMLEGAPHSRKKTARPSISTRISGHFLSSC